MARAAAEWAALAAVVAGGGLAAGRVRVSRDGGRSYPRSVERALTRVLPVERPAAVRVYDDHGQARCLSVDLDVARGGQSQVDADAERLLELLARCGGRVFTDRSPTGGRHVYLPLATPVLYTELRPVLYALATLLPSLDVAPGVNLLAGCIRPPGARHKTGGWQALDGPLAAAGAVARDPNPPAVWAALSAALRPQLRALALAAADPSVALPSDAAGAAGPKQRRALAAPPARDGGPRPLRPAPATTARTGSYDTARYRSPSEARQSVLAAAAGSGWTYPDVLEQLHGGAWPGLWSFYTRYADRHRAEALAGDWLSALTYASNSPQPSSPDLAPDAHQAAALPGSRPDHQADAPPPHPAGVQRVHSSDTREPTTHRGALPPLPTVTSITRPPAPPPPLGPDGPPLTRAVGGDGLPADNYQWLRAWWTATRLAERERHHERAGHAARLVLRAVGNAAQKTGRRHLAFGVRALALAAGLSRTTVAHTLRVLREHPDPLLVRLVEGRGLAGDLYELRVPDNYYEQARTYAWRPGPIEALLPCFRILGVPAAFVYETLDRHPQNSWDIATTALLSVRATQTALTELAAHGLAQRGRHGWTRGPADPHQVAHTVGADQQLAEQATRYRAERLVWQARLGATPGPTITHLLTAPPAPADPEPRPPVHWLPQHSRPPPRMPSVPDNDPAVQLVLHLLGGTVFARGTQARNDTPLWVPQLPEAPP